MSDLKRHTAIRKKKIGTINLDPRSWIVERQDNKYFGVERGPRSKVAYLNGDRMAVYTTMTLGFDRPSDAADALRIYLKGKGL